MAKGQGLREDLLSTVYALVLSEFYSMYVYYMLKKHLYLIATVIYFFHIQILQLSNFFKKLQTLTT